MKEESIVDDLYTSDGQLKHRVKLTPAFLRNPYAYTPIEVKNENFEKLRRIYGNTH
jgi:hypothetical protein